MPAQYRLWFHNQEGVFPRCDSACQPNDQRAVQPVEFRPFGLALQHEHLLAQQGDFDDQFMATAPDILHCAPDRANGERLGPVAHVVEQTLAEPSQGIDKR